MSEFTYLSEKILAAEFVASPFKHLLIEDFLSAEHLGLLLGDTQVHFDETKNTEDLVRQLDRKGYKIQAFPGCTSDIREYLHYYNAGKFPSGRKGTPIESYGITYRLAHHNDPTVAALVVYMNGMEFKKALETKFTITKQTNIITAIQKNLSHYEISPHPDVREKALTYLLNINKDTTVDDEVVHTHLLAFKEEWNFVKEYWETNLAKNRCWVPWDWCETKVVTNKNNSIVLFAPGLDTLHGVKMIYDHNKFQRTQLYGNLMGVEKIVAPMNYKELLEVKKQNENI